MIDIPLAQPGTGAVFTFHDEQIAADARARGWVDVAPVPAASVEKPVEKPKPKRKK